MNKPPKTISGLILTGMISLIATPHSFGSGISSTSNYNPSSVTITGGTITVSSISADSYLGILPHASYIYIRDEKASTTAAQTLAAAWTKRDLNTIVVNEGSFVSLASSVISVQPGSYTFKVRTPSYAGLFHKCRLANTSDSTYHYGSSVYASAAGGVQNDSICEGKFIISSQKNFEVQHYASGGGAGGMPTSLAGIIEVYSSIELWRDP